MRILIKGGVWKNTEDEILKAAVMKYGLNQWARISSLLVRKSAKQCKARWYEWLDPSIKKTEWTREEDEKLLHLAKLMPTQWRTIAPIVGRTPAQCLERYEKLLDAAAAKDESYDPADDPRRLRPGEIDPNPEGKPARPDPVDMDEDEKEMLSEARARLANTKGKKAKRKAREAQLEEARRLASLQKKRELKAAGIEMREMKRKSKGLNYNNEVAFERKPAQGFYDVEEERQMTKDIGKEFRPITLEEMEGRKRKDIERNLRKQDAERDARRAENDQAAVIAQNLQMHDASTSRRRGKMMLPAPQLSEEDLAAIARQQGAGLDPEHTEGGDNSKRLIGNYDAPTSMATPMRTPRVMGANGLDHITMEAQNLARLQAGQTPLAGGANPMIHASDFSGVTPRQSVAATPNPHLGMTPRGGETPSLNGMTPGQTPGRSVAGTPLNRKFGGNQATPSQTPARDALGLNTPSNFEAYTKREAKQREAMLKANLKAGLASLPEPEYQYEITMPDVVEGDEKGEVIEEDAADIAARKKRLIAEREAAELKKRSQVLQRQLPRPSVLTVVSEQYGNNSGQAEALIVEEMVNLLQHEAVKYPRDKKKGKRKRDENDAPLGPLGPWIEFTTSELEDAKLLLQEELMDLNRNLGHSGSTEQEDLDAWNSAISEFIYLPNQERYGRIASATNTDKIESLQYEHKVVVEEMTKEAGRAKKLEGKLDIKTHGYVTREKALKDDIFRSWNSIQELLTQLKCFQRLAEQEEKAIPKRISEAKSRLETQKAQEIELQEEYKQKSLLRDDLTVRLGVLKARN